jgi:hypothetical protein
MSPGHTAASHSWCNAGILILEDGLMYARAINGRSSTSGFGTAANLSSFERVVLLSIVGIAVSAALLLTSSAETVATITAGLGS